MAFQQVKIEKDPPGQVFDFHDPDLCDRPHLTIQIPNPKLYDTLFAPQEIEGAKPSQLTDLFNDFDSVSEYLNHSNSIIALRFYRLMSMVKAQLEYYQYRVDSLSDSPNPTPSTPVYEEYHSYPGDSSGSHAHCLTLNGNNGSETNSDDHAALAEFMAETIPLGLAVAGGPEVGRAFMDTNKQILEHHQFDTEGNGWRAIQNRERNKAAGIKQRDKKRDELNAQKASFRAKRNRLDRENLRRLKNTPLWEPSPKIRVELDEDFLGPVVKPQINGNNGSATNSDDVNPKGPRGMKGKKKQAKKTKQPKKNKGNQRRAPAGNNSSTVYASGIPMVSQVPKLKEKYVCSGEEFPIADLITPSSIIGVGHIFSSFSVDRKLFASTELSRKFQSFDNWKVKKIEVRAIPALATNTNGLAWVIAEPDPKDTLPVGTVKPADYFGGHKGSKLHSIFGAPWKVTLPTTGRVLFTDVPNITTGIAQGDSRESSAGTISFAAGNGLTTTSTSVASMWIKVWATFFNGAFTEDEDVLCCSKAVSYSGQNIFAASTTFNAAVMFPVATGASSTNLGVPYVESSYQSDFYSGGNFQLLPGMYLVNFTLLTSANPGALTSGWNISGTATYSGDINSYTEANTEQYEFANNPGGLATTNYVTQFIGYLRVITPATGSRYCLFNPTGSWANSVAVQGYGLYVARLPNVIGAANLEWFPKGNSGSAVELKNESHILVHVRNDCSKNEVSTTKVVLQEEYDEFLEWQAHKKDAITLVKTHKEPEEKQSQTSSSSSYFWPASK